MIVWDKIEIAKGKELSLFPFTKKAISNLYMCILQPDYRTPRYLLRDVIERSMRNYLFKKESFPEFAIERINDIPFESLYVSTYIHQQVEEVEGIPITNLMAKNLKNNSQNAHCPEWNSLVSIYLYIFASYRE